LKALELENKKLFVLGDVNKKCIFVVTQFKASSVVSSLELSTYAILNANNLVFFREFFGDN
jgi:large subunit ribosomal protein L4